MNDPTDTTHDPSGGVVGLARRIAPDLRVVSASEAVVRTRNVVGLVPSAEVARKIVLELESMSDESDEVGESDATIGVVVMASAAESAGDGSTSPSADPEGVGRWLVPRIVAGLVIGAVIGAALGAGLAALFDGPILGAALGGAFLLSIIVAIWLTFAKLGGSEAYRQTFVESHDRELTVVSLHTDDASRADEAFERLQEHAGVQVTIYDESLSTAIRQ